MTTPALIRLREHFPYTRISLLTPAKLADLWSHHPALDEVIMVAQGESPWSVGRRLRDRRFDLAIIFPNSPRAAIETWIARIPDRVGYSGNARWPFLTRRISRPPYFVRMRKRSLRDIRQRLQSASASPERLPTTAHHLHHYLHLVASLGANPNPVPPRLEVAAVEIRESILKFGIASASAWIGLSPGAEYGPAKRWPANRFLEAAVQIQKRTGHRWILLGGQGDLEVTSKLSTALATQFPDAPPLNLAGRTSLRELCSVLRTCRALFTNDSGPMHVAAALRVPVIALFGSTSPELTGPGLPNDPLHRVLHTAPPCAPCFLRECPIDFRCMNSLSVEAVSNAVISHAIPGPTCS